MVFPIGISSIENKKTLRSRGLVTTADSRIILKDQNDLSNPGAQRRVSLSSSDRQTTSPWGT